MSFTENSLGTFHHANMSPRVLIPPAGNASRGRKEAGPQEVRQALKPVLVVAKQWYGDYLHLLCDVIFWASQPQYIDSFHYQDSVHLVW